MIVRIGAVAMLFVGTSLSAQAPAVRVWTSGITARPAAWRGACPKEFTFDTYIVASGPVTVQYRWERSDGATGPTTTATLAPPKNPSATATESPMVRDSWTLGAAGMSVDGWARVHILSPVDRYSGKATFHLRCE